jgi:hypothetical protein
MESIKQEHHCIIGMIIEVTEEIPHGSSLFVQDPVEDWIGLDGL